MRLQRNLLLAAFALGVVPPLLLRDEYLMHIGVLIMFSIMIATSFNLIVGYVGEFSLGQTAFFGIGAYTAALLSLKLGAPAYVTIPAGGIVGGVFGLLIGSITLRLRGPFFVIVTLCFAEVLRLIANNWIALTNGPMGLSGVPKPQWIESQDVLGQKTSFYYIGLLMAAVTLYLAYRFVNSNVGRAAIAIRENRLVAQSVGVWPFYYGLVTFIVAAILCGFAGAFYAHYISFVGPEVFGFSVMASMIIMVLVGGKGTLIGPVIGAIIVVLLEEYLRDFKELRLSIFGLVVIAIVIFLPRGLMGFVVRQQNLYKPQ